jgi:hypothetical protein
MKRLRPSSSLQRLLRVSTASARRRCARPQSRRLGNLVGQPTGTASPGMVCVSGVPAFRSAEARYVENPAREGGRAEQIEGP